MQGSQKRAAVRGILESQSIWAKFTKVKVAKISMKHYEVTVHLLKSTND